MASEIVEFLALFFYAPLFFFMAGFLPFGQGWLAIVPAAGTVGLACGLFLGFRARSRRLLVFLAPFLLTQFLVAVAWALPGAFAVSLVHPAVIVFMGVQISIAVYLVFRATEARAAATSLAVFNLSYAVTAIFMASLFSSDYFMGPQISGLEGAAAPARLHLPVNAPVEAVVA